MKLNRGTMRPGQVMKVLEDGSIKAFASGLFSRHDDPEKLPPVLPFFFGSHANAYSSPLEYDEVWILNFDDNPQQLYWIRKDKMPENNKDIMGEENVEIICNRETGSTWAVIYFSDDSGWIIRRDETTIQLRPNGSILLKTPYDHRTVDINSESISLGSEGKSEHPAVYGDVLTELLENVQTALELTKQAAGGSPYTKPIEIALGMYPAKIKELIPKITSPHVTLD